MSKWIITIDYGDRVEEREFDHGELSRRRSRCKACVAIGVELRRILVAESACRPGGWAISAPGW